MSVVESVQAFVNGMTQPLEGRRAIAAAEALRLARLLDEEEAGSAAAALSRELRLLIASMDSAVTLVPNTAVPPEDGPREDPVTRVRDEVARKRAERAGQAL